MEISFHMGMTPTGHETACLLEAGLTYILYQRGQIPLPYQQLQKSAIQHKEVLLKETCTSTTNGTCKDHDNERHAFSSDAPRERISSMILERKKRMLVHKMERHKRQALAQESKAFHSIQPALDVLQGLLTDCSLLRNATDPGQSNKVMSLALTLGPSLYSPKEVYCFDLPSFHVPQTNGSHSKGNQFENGVLRQFYKEIITNGDLLDFTSRPLGKTYAHLCLVVLGDLSSILQGNTQYKDVMRLPTLPPPILQSLARPVLSDSVETNEDSSLSPRPYSNFPFRCRPSSRNKCFKFKLLSPGSEILGTSVNCTDYLHHSDNKCENGFGTNNCFSDDILFDNNSFSCYQIPLRFKGVQCKNKRL